jgi:hypothetical protein
MSNLVKQLDCSGLGARLLAAVCILLVIPLDATSAAECNIVQDPQGSQSSVHMYDVWGGYTYPIDYYDVWSIDVHTDDPDCYLLGYSNVAPLLSYTFRPMQLTVISGGTFQVPGTSLLGYAWLTAWHWIADYQIPISVCDGLVYYSPCWVPGVLIPYAVDANTLQLSYASQEHDAWIFPY